MSEKQIEERKENIKPRKLYSIEATCWNDGIVSGLLSEYVNIGREKNKKVIFSGGEAGKDFLSTVRSIVPSAIPKIETLVNRISDDSTNEDTKENEKIGKCVITIYSDGFVESDLAEIIRGTRGAPKVWRCSIKEFCSAIQAQIGDASENFKALT